MAAQQALSDLLLESPADPECEKFHGERRSIS